MPTALLHFLHSYGYLAVALLVTLEGLGLPVPGETALITAAAFAADGNLSIVGVMLASSLGAILGGSGGYAIGRAGGLALIRRHGRWVGISSTRLDKAHAYFDRYGARTVFIGRFVAVLRIVVALLAGVAAMPFGEFTVYNALGGVCWSLIFGSLGYLFGRNLPRLERGLGQAGFVLALLVGLVIMVAVLWKWSEDHREELWQRATRLWARAAESRAFGRIEARHQRARVFLAERFIPGEYLALHAVAGFVLSLVTLAIFAALTEGVFGAGTLARFDMALAITLHQASTPAAAGIARALSTFGTVPVMSVIGIAVAVVLAMRRQHLLLGGWVMALVGSAVLTGVLKLLVHRPRPAFVPPLAGGAIWSFPSGHALGAVVAYGMVAYLITRSVTGRRAHAVIWIASLLLIAAIGASRLYLGIHYFSDIMGGFAAGTVWLVAIIIGIEVARRENRERGARSM
ncbi:MAG TPA: bifunctional DedA family/phosphatase PAP2 family protein, partial [Gemmatimonadaceae bacterium]|nr:bifunctional DedA family/phosphatase PAP2 family protein [Gemmatimonadaceae bacterium]